MATGRPMHIIASMYIRSPHASHTRYTHSYVLCMKQSLISASKPANGKPPAPSTIPWCMDIAGYCNKIDSQQQPTVCYKQTSKSLPVLV